MFHCRQTGRDIGVVARLSTALVAVGEGVVRQYVAERRRAVEVDGGIPELFGAFGRQKAVLHRDRRNHAALKIAAGLAAVCAHIVVTYIIVCAIYCCLRWLI